MEPSLYFIIAFLQAVSIKGSHSQGQIFREEISPYSYLVYFYIWNLMGTDRTFKLFGMTLKKHVQASHLILPFIFHSL